MNREKRILIVDDLSVQRAFFGKSLAKQGYQVRGVSDGMAALNVQEEWGAHLILLDVVMAPMNGFDVLRKIKAMDRDKSEQDKTKIIMCSVKGGKVDELWAKNQGADDYLVKPVAEEDMMKMVKKWLGGE